MKIIITTIMILMITIIIMMKIIKVMIISHKNEIFRLYTHG